MGRSSNPFPDALILEAMDVALIAVDTDLRIVRLNPLAEALTNTDATSAIGKPCQEALKGCICQDSCPLRRSLSAATTCLSGTVVMQPASGPATTVEMTASTLFGTEEEPKPIGAVALLRKMDVDQVLFFGSRIFVSRTPRMRQLFETLPSLASSDAPILISGERGSGRGALSETLHNLRHADQPFEILDCKDNPQNPREARPIPSIEEGTLVLEDVCNASPLMQQELLAWLEDGRDAGIRLISTATSQLDSRIEQGTFRRDLYYRLNVLNVDLPNLRERREDVPLLAEQFIEASNAKKKNAHVAGLSAEAMTLLLDAEFPENVRQLRLVLEHALDRAQGDLIEANDLDLRVSSAILEEETIRRTLKRVGGNVTKAAREMRMHRTTLWRKIKRFQIKIRSE